MLNNVNAQAADVPTVGFRRLCYGISYNLAFMYTPHTAAHMSVSADILNPMLLEGD